MNIGVHVGLSYQKWPLKFCSFKFAYFATSNFEAQINASNLAVTHTCTIILKSAAALLR